jgi:hypothetical protein
MQFNDPLKLTKSGTAGIRVDQRATTSITVNILIGRDKDVARENGEKAPFQGIVSPAHQRSVSRSEASNASMSRIEKMSDDIGKHIVDCRTLSAMELRQRYRGEANTHRNVLQRCKTQGRTVHPEFRVFRDFLRHVGPQPCRGATLDRTNNADPEYAPGKVRWADKRTQNSNKGDTLVFQHSRVPDTYTVSRLAKLHKKSPSTIRKQYERGWTDDEIIEGSRAGYPAGVGKCNLAPVSKGPRSHRNGCRT